MTTPAERVQEFLDGFGGEIVAFGVRTLLASDLRALLSDSREATDTAPQPAGDGEAPPVPVPKVTAAGYFQIVRDLTDDPVLLAAVDKAEATFPGAVPVPSTDSPRPEHDPRDWLCTQRPYASSHRRCPVCRPTAVEATNA